MSKINRFLKFYPLPYFLILIAVIFSPGKVIAIEMKSETGTVHIVSSGESLNGIARRYSANSGILTHGELVSEIQKLNGISGTLIHPKQRLLIPMVQSNPIVARTVAKPKNFKARGIYINRYSMGSKKLTELVNDAINSGCNAVILDAKDMSGQLSYPSRVKLAQEIGSNNNPVVSSVSVLIRYLHEKGLHVVVRQVLFFDPILAAQRPELTLHSATTGEQLTEKGKTGWVDPSRPEVQKYNLDIARELAELGVDEIQFDYIRYPTTENIRETRAGPGKTETTRHEIITAFLARAKRELAPFKVLLSIDVLAISGWGHPEDTRLTGQKIEDLAQYIDVISPMIYPSHFSGPFQGVAHPGDQPFKLVTKSYRKFLHLLKNSDVTIRPWIQAFPYGTSIFNKTYILEELRALAQLNSGGWLLWSAGNKYRVSWRALALWNEPELDDDLLFEQSTL